VSGSQPYMCKSQHWETLDDANPLDPARPCLPEYRPQDRIRISLQGLVSNDLARLKAGRCLHCVSVPARQVSAEFLPGSATRTASWLELAEPLARKV